MQGFFRMKRRDLVGARRRDLVLHGAFTITLLVSRRHSLHVINSLPPGTGKTTPETKLPGSQTLCQLESSVSE